MKLLFFKRLLTYPKKYYVLCIMFFCLLILGTSHHTTTDIAQKQTEQVLTLPEPSIIEPLTDQATWQTITTKPGDSLASLFSHMGVDTHTLNAILYKNPHAKNLTHIRPNQVVQFLIHNTQLEQLILPISKTQQFNIKRVDDHFDTQLETHQTTIRTETINGTITRSLYTTAQKEKIPYTLMQQMANILSWQINFSRDLREGDTFSIHYEVHYINNERIRAGDVLSVTYNNHGKQYQAIRHQSQSGKTDYFTPEGKSVRKAFSRYPVQFSHISSSFNLSRMHPILKKRRPHRGIDLAAPIGTPIRATSDGRITSIGYEHGYGNKIKIQHAGPYESLYAHLLKFKSGLKRGDFVNRGDVIGYVGQTGLADGPHCHYEFRVNHEAKNPATIALPEAQPIPAAELAAFKQHAAIELAALALPEKTNKHVT